MKVLAIDESGKPKSLEQDKAFVLAGVLFDESTIMQIRKEMAAIRSKHDLIPEIEFHTRDLVHGKRAFKDISNIEDRIAILEDLYSVLDKYSIAIVATIYKRETLDPDVAESRAFKYLTERALIAFDKKRRVEAQEHMVIIIDESSYYHDRNVRQLIKFEVKDGIYSRTWLVSHYVLRTPLFMSSKECRLLQLVDLVAYTIRRGLSDKPNTGRIDMRQYYQKYIEPKLDRCRDGRIQGCGLKEI